MILKQLGLLAVAVTVIGCDLGLLRETDPGARYGLFFPQHHDSFVPLALVEGSLEARDGCIWIVLADKPRVVVWPAEYRPRMTTEQRLEIVDDRGQVVASAGNIVRGNGAELTEQGARQVSGKVAPSSCRANDSYVIVGSLQRK